MSESKRQYRTTIEIIANILEISKEGSRKTRIMYQGNLSYDLVQRYLKHVERLGLIEVKNTKDNEHIYMITEKGQQFLEDFYELQKHSEIANSKKQILENVLKHAE